MKNKWLYVLCVLVSMTCGCDNQSQGKPGIQEFCVMKFKDPSYKNCILINDCNIFLKEGETPYFAMTSSKESLPHGCWETMQGQNPYILLKEDYVLVDWRWQDRWFEPVLIFAPWQDMQSWTQRWDTTVSHVYNPISTEYSCSIQNFDQEMGNQYGGSLRYYPYITNYFIAGRSHISDSSGEIWTEDLTKGMTLEEVEAYYDAVYAEIAERLDSAIARGQFPLKCMHGYTFE